VNLDCADARIFTDFSLSGRIFTVTTEREISVFTLPIFATTARNLPGQGPSQFGGIEYAVGNRSELKISHPMKLIFPSIKGQSSNSDRKNNSTDLNFSAAIVVSTIVTSVGTESNNFNNTDSGSEPSEKVGTNIVKKMNMKSRKSISAVLPLNSGGPTAITVEKLSLKIQFAVFHRITAQWMTVDGLVSCEKTKTEKKMGENSENILSFVDLKKDLEITDLKKWKLSGAVTAFCFNEKRSIVALGLDDGKFFFLLCLFDLFVCLFIYFLCIHSLTDLLIFISSLIYLFGYLFAYSFIILLVHSIIYLHIHFHYHLSLLFILFPFLHIFLIFNFIFCRICRDLGPSDSRQSTVRCTGTARTPCYRTYILGPRSVQQPLFRPFRGWCGEHFELRSQY
jgi:hypothetical protein